MFSYTEDNRAVNMHKRMSEWKEHLRKPLQKRRIRTFDETIVRRIFRNYIMLCRTLMKRVRYLSCEFCRNMKGETACSYPWLGEEKSKCLLFGFWCQSLPLMDRLQLSKVQMKLAWKKGPALYNTLLYCCERSFYLKKGHPFISALSQTHQK